MSKCSTCEFSHYPENYGPCEKCGGDGSRYVKKGTLPKKVEIPQDTFNQAAWLKETIYKCSMCGYKTPEGSLNYCPNCGAKMTGRQVEIHGKPIYKTSTGFKIKDMRDPTPEEQKIINDAIKNKSVNLGINIWDLYEGE